MTREEAVKILKSGVIIAATCDMDDYAEAREMAIKALEEDPCKDCSTKHELEVNLKNWSNAYRRGLEAGRKEQELYEELLLTEAGRAFLKGIKEVIDNGKE